MHPILTAGVRPVWVIWPKTKQIDAWLPDKPDLDRTLNISDSLDGLDVVSGFSYALADLFA